MNSVLLTKLLEAGTPPELVGEVAMALARAEAAQDALTRFREKDLAHTKAYRARRGLPDSGWHSLVGAVIERDGFVCTYCGKNLAKGRYAVDHIVPLGRGGTNDLNNLTMACIGCNSSKRDRLLGTEWTPPKDRLPK